MAPGCTAVIQQKDQQIEQYNTKNSLEQINKQEANSEDTNLLERNNYYVRYDEIYLDQIPLPSTPPPPQDSKHDVVSNQQFFISDTVDSFEILEQTIMKQKRVAKMKNTDLRLKVLLKRTFNLVCEIMDHENGFDSDFSDEVVAPDMEAKEKTQEEINEDYDDDSSDSDEEEDESDNDYIYEKEKNQIIPIIEKKCENSALNSHIEFETITLNQYNFDDLDLELENGSNNSLLDDQNAEKSNEHEHYISLEPIVTFIEQQSVSNKRKLTDDIESDLFNKRFKLNRSLSTSDDENDPKLISTNNYLVESNSNCFMFNNLTNNDLKIKSSKIDDTNLKIFLKSAEPNNYNFKIASINFYA